MSLLVELTPIGIGKRINVDGYFNAFKQMVLDESRILFKYFDIPIKAFTRHAVSTTQNRPVGLHGGDIDVVVGVLRATDDNAIFSYVNWGTGPRIIRAKNAPTMRFRPGYKSATRPYSLETRQPWKKYGRYVHKSVVVHSTAARRFDSVIHELRVDQFPRDARKIMKTAAKKTWI